MALWKRHPTLFRKKNGYFYPIIYNPETKKQKWHALGTDRQRTAHSRFRQICDASKAPS